MKNKRKPSQTAQRKALENKGIPSKGLSKQTTRRLYKYYIERQNPASNPRSLAYGEQKRLEKRIEENPNILLTAGTKEKITTKKYMKNAIKPIDQEIRRSLPARTNYYPNRYYHNVDKVQDHIEHRFDPEEYLAVKKASGIHNITKVMNKAQKYIVPMLIDDMRLFVRLKGPYYRMLMVNMMFHFVMTDENEIQTDHYKYVPFSDMKYGPLEKFIDFYFYKMDGNVVDTIKKGFFLCKTASGQAGSSLIKIMVFFSTNRRASAYEKLRAHRINRRKR